MAASIKLSHHRRIGQQSNMMGIVRSEERRVGKERVSPLNFRRGHTMCALVTGVQTCALPILLVTFNRSGPTVDAILQAKRHGHESTDKYAARGAAHRRDGWQPACWKRGRHHAVDA